MDKDIYTLLIEEIIAPFKEKIEELERAIYCKNLYDNAINRDIPYMKRGIVIKRKHCYTLRDLLDKGDKKTLLCFLKLMANDSIGGTNLTAVCHLHRREDACKCDKILIRDLYKYIGEDFAPKDEVNKVLIAPNNICPDCNMSLVFTPFE